MTIPIWIWILLVCVCGVASCTDIRSTRIPNWLSIPLFLAGLIHAAGTEGVTGLLDAIGGSVIAGGLFILAYAINKGGGGDAKLMLGLGAWVGVDLAVILLAAVTAAGFVESIVAIMIRGGVRDVPIVLLSSVMGVLRLFHKQPATDDASTSDPTMEGRSDHRSRPKHWIPFAPAILVGTILTWVWDATGGFS